MNKQNFTKFILFCSIMNILVFVFLAYDIFCYGINMDFLLNIIIMITQLVLFFITVYFGNKIFGKVTKEKSYIFKKYRQSKESEELILNHIPDSVVVLNTKGIIEYVNPGTKKVLGSTEGVGLNMLKLPTVKQTKIYEGILNSLKGIPTEIFNENYTTHITGVKKILNIYIYPIFKQDSKEVKKVILILQDITRELEYKKEVESTYLSTIEALAKIIDARDEYTGEHSHNVSKYTHLICKNLNLSHEECSKIRIAAGIHDIGKIGVDDAILKKPDKLTFEEYSKMKEHSNIGADIISNIHGFEVISKIIRHHHERWDGNGYPNKLKAQDIPLGAQIIAIADTYDAIISNRVYRQGLGHKRAIQILLEEKGKQFNSRLVDIFIREITTEHVNLSNAV